MAGVQWSGGSMTRRKMHGTLLHNSKDTRLEHQHTNEDIDPSRTHLNWSVLGRTYAQKLSFYEQRMSEVEYGRESSGKNERIVAHDLIIYCPPEVEAQGMKAVRRFFKFTYATLAELVGVENVIDLDVHLDEQHDYVDPDTKEIVHSRIHGHFTFIPTVTEKDVRVREKVQAKDADGNPLFETVTDKDGTEHQEPVWERDKAGRIKRRGSKVRHVRLDMPELNDSAVATRDNIIRSNELMDAMCKERFGCTYTTGKGRKRRGKAVEQLKIDSAQAADEMVRDAEKRVSEMVAELADKMAQVHALEEQAAMSEADAMVAKQEAEDAASQVSQAQEKVDAIVEAASLEASTIRREAESDAKSTRQNAEIAKAQADLIESQASKKLQAAETREQEARAARKAYRAAERAYEDATPTVANISPGAFLERCFSELAELARPKRNPMANMVNLSDEPHEDMPEMSGDPQVSNAIRFVQRFFKKIGKTIKEFGDEVARKIMREQGMRPTPSKQSIAEAERADKEFYANLVFSKTEAGGVSHGRGGRQMGE